MPLTLYRSDPTAEFFTDERCHILELLNSPAFPGASIARARVEPGVTTELHGLDVREIYVIVSGSGRMESDSQSFDVGPGDCVDIPVGNPQRITNSGSVDLVFLCLCLPRFVPASYRSLEA